MHDQGLDALLDLNGIVMVVDSLGGHWVKFVAHRVPYSLEKPHGLDYSITLHTKNGERLVGFDNAHSVGKKTKIKTNDHKHFLTKIGKYDYSDAETLLVDFWNEVDKILKIRGVIL